MSSIDERIVEMRFDNKEFEPGAKTTLQTLEKLKTALNFGDSGKGIDKIDSSIKGLDVSAITSGIEALQNRFSTLGIVGMRVIQNLTDSMMGFASKTISFFTNGIVQGGFSRASNIENAKFQIQGLGYEWSQLEKQIDFAVNQTAYGLDSAATAASTLLSSGVQISDSFDAASGNIDQMGMALRAISGVAAQTNSDYDSIANIFTAIAGNGRLMGDQLNQLARRGLNAAAVLGKALGKSEKEIRDMASKSQISFETFSQVMYDAFAEHAVKANETLTGSLSNVRAALARIGQAFYTPLIEQNGPLVKFFNALRIQVNAVKAGITGTGSAIEKLSNAAIGIVDRFRKSVEKADIEVLFKTINNLIDACKNSIGGLKTVLQPIEGAFKRAFPKSLSTIIGDASEKLKEFTKGFWSIRRESALVENGDLFAGMSDNLLKRDQVARTAGVLNDTNGTLEKIGRVAEGVFGVFRIGKSAIDSLAKALTPVVSYLWDLGGGFLEIASKIGDAISKFADFVEESDFFDKKIQSAIEFVEKLIYNFEYLTGIDLKLPTADDLVNGFENAIKKVKEFKDKASSYFEQLWFRIKYIFGLEDFKISVEDIKSALDGVKQKFEEIKKVFGLEGFSVSLEDLENGFEGLKKKLDETKLVQDIKILGQVFRSGIKLLTGIDLGNIEDLRSVIADIKDRFAELKKQFEIEKGKIITAIGEVHDGFQKLTGIDIHIPSIYEIGYAIYTIFEKLTELKNFLVDQYNNREGIGGFFRVIQEAFTNFHVDWSGFDAFVDDFGEKLTPFQSALKIVSSLISFVLSLAGQAIPLIKDAGGKIIDYAKKLWDGLKELFEGGDLGTSLKNSTFAAAIYQVAQVLRQLNRFLPNGESKNPIKVLVSTMNGLKDTLISFRDNIKIGYWLKVGAALMLIAVAIKILGSLEPQELAMGFGAVLLIFKEIQKVMEQFGRTLINTDTMVQTAKAMVILSLAIGVLALSAKTLGKLSIGDLAKGIIGITILLNEMVAVAKRLSSIDEIAKGLGGLIIMAVAVRVLASAMKTIAKLDLTSMVSSFFVISALVQGLTSVAEKLAGADNGMMKGLGGLLVMAISVRILASAMKSLAKMDLTAMLFSFLAISALLQGLTSIAMKLSGDSSIMKGIGSLLIMAVSVKVLASAMKSLQSMDLTTMLFSFLAISALLQGLASIAIKLSGDEGGMLKAAAGMLVMGVAIRIIASAIKVLGELSLAEMGIALLTLVSVLFMLSVAMTEMDGGLKGAAALLVMASALIPLAIALKILGSLDFKSMMIALVTLLGAIAMLGVTSVALEHFIPLMVQLAGTFLIFSIAAALLGVACIAVAAGLAALGPALYVFGTGIMNFVVAIIKGLEDASVELLYAVMNIIVAIGEGIAKGAFAIKDAAVGLVTAICQAIVEALPAIISMGVLVIVAFLEGIGNNIKRIVVAAVTLISEFMNGIAEMMPVLMLAGRNFIVSFINSLANAIRESEGDLIAAFKNLISAMIEFALSALQGLLSSIPGIGDKINNYLEQAKDKVRETLAPEDGKETGEEYAGAVAEGIQNEEVSIKEAGTHAGKTGYFGLEEGLSGTEEVGSESVSELAHGIEVGTPEAEEAAENVGVTVLDNLDQKEIAAKLGGEDVSAYLSAYGMDVSDYGEGLSESVLSGIESTSSGYLDMGELSSELYSEGILGNLNPAETAGETLASTVTESAQNGSASGTARSAGSKIVEEYSSGVESGLETAKSAGSNISQNAADGANSNLGEMLKSGKSAATNWNTGLTTGSSLTTKSNGAKLTADAASGATSSTAQEKMKAAGDKSKKQYNAGLISDTGTTKSAGGTVATAGSEGARGKVGDFRSTGVFLTYGMANGIASSEALAYLRAKAKQAALEAKNAAERTLQVASPSKVGIRIGEFFTMGLANGIMNLAGMVGDSSSAMSKEAIKGVEFTSKTIAGLLSDDVDLSPTIRPVLDTTEIQNGLGLVDNMLNGQRSMALAAGMTFSNQGPSIGEQIDMAVDKALKGIFSAAEEASAKQQYTINVPLNIDKRQLARATATVTREELNRIDYLNNRKVGIA